MNVFRDGIFACLGAGSLLALSQPGFAADPAMPAYFAFEQEPPGAAGQKSNSFVFKLIDAQRMAEARNMLKSGSKLHVQGTIDPHKAAYNPEWSYVLSPATISFFENQIEVCDANMVHVEQHLDEVGGSFLPHSHWCPWSSTLVREVTDPQTEEPRP